MADITANIVVSNPRPVFTDSRTFKAVANGKIYIGLIGTDPTIPANQIPVYVENEDGSLVQISQPLITNAGGKITYGGQVVKVVTSKGHSMAVYDAYNAEVDYIANVLKYDPDQLRNELNTEGTPTLVDDSRIKVLQPVTGAVARTQHSKNAERISVKDFGAKGDGVTDDTAAIDLACLSLKGGINDLYFPEGKYIYNGTGIYTPQDCSVIGENYITTINATANTNSGYLIKINGFRATVQSLTLKGNPSNPLMKAISSYYNTELGGVRDVTIEDFHYGIDIDKSWYTIFKGIRFRRSSTAVVLNGSHIRLGYNYQSEEVNGIVFEDVWCAENQVQSISVYSPTQAITFLGGSLETTGGARIKFFNSANVRAFVICNTYIEGDSSSGVFAVEGQSITQRITFKDCMFRLGSSTGTFGKNITAYIDGGWSNSPTVSLQGNNTKVWFSRYRDICDGWADGISFSGSGDYDGANMHSASAYMDHRPMDLRDWNSYIPPVINYKTHPNNTTAVPVYKVYLPAGGEPKIMLIEITAVTKSASDSFTVGNEKYLVSITLPEATTAGSGTLVTKIASASSSGAALLTDPAFSVTPNGYDLATDSIVYTISHQVANSSRLGNTMFIAIGSYIENNVSYTTRRWKIQRV
ncbi:hypothetical protein R2281_003818 [Cronobacter dublinensis]|nr:hypothetical protein [Cronobacter dublinensis]